MMNTELAGAVISFAADGIFFSSVVGRLDRFPYRVNDFHEALSIARLVEGEIKEPNYQSLRASFLLNETRVRGCVYARSDWREISRLENMAFAQLEKAVERIPDKYRDAIDDVLAHLAMCWLSRITVGRDRYFERIFEAYESGFWPCGWIDAGSQSDLLVFVPPLP